MTDTNYKLLVSIHKKLIAGEMAGLYEVSQKEWDILENLGRFTYNCYGTGYDPDYVYKKLSEEEQMLAARLP